MTDFDVFEFDDGVDNDSIQSEHDDTAPEPSNNERFVTTRIDTQAAPSRPEPLGGFVMASTLASELLSPPTVSTSTAPNAPIRAHTRQRVTTVINAMRRDIEDSPYQPRVLPGSCFSQTTSNALTTQVKKEWEPYEFQMNALTRSIGIPCSVQMITKQKYVFDALHARLHALKTRLIKIPTTNDPASVSLTPRDARQWIQVTDGHDHGGDAVTTRAVNALGIDMTEIDSITKGTIVEILTKIHELEALVPKLESVMTIRTQLHLLESQLRRTMFPRTIDDITALLLHSGINKNNAIEVGSLPNEVCVICRSAEGSNLYVRIQPRCLEHVACQKPQRIGCSCTSVQAMHFDCMATLMVAEYSGDKENVGRSAARCPLCRQDVCYNDIICLRIVRPQPNPLSPTTQSSTKKCHARDDCDDIEDKEKQQDDSDVSITDSLQRMRRKRGRPAARPIANTNE